MLSSTGGHQGAQPRPARRQAPAHRHGNRKPTGHRTHRAKARAGGQPPTPRPREAAANEENRATATNPDSERRERRNDRPKAEPPHGATRQRAERSATETTGTKPTQRDRADTTHPHSQKTHRGTAPATSGGNHPPRHAHGDQRQHGHDERRKAEERSVPCAGWRDVRHHAGGSGGVPAASAGWWNMAVKRALSRRERIGKRKAVRLWTATAPLRAAKRG